VGERGVLVPEVAADGGLAVGAGVDEAGMLERSARGNGGEELPDRVGALVFEWLGRHRQRGIVTQQCDHARHVAGLECLDEAADELALFARPG
jgi:hypothetical protein